MEAIWNFYIYQYYYIYKESNGANYFVIKGIQNMELGQIFLEAYNIWI